MAYRDYIVTADVSEGWGNSIEREFTIEAHSKQEAAKIVRDKYGGQNIKVDMPDDWETNKHYILRSEDLDYEPSYIFDDDL